MSQRIEIKKHQHSVGNSPTGSAVDFSITVQLLNLFRRVVSRWKLIGAVSGAVMAITAAFLFTTPNSYRSTATILPSGGFDKLSELKSLAGMGSSNVDGNASELFPSIIQSRQTKDAILDREFSFVEDGESRTITIEEYFSLTNKDILYASLDGMIAVTVDPRTRILTASIETSYPDLSRAILTGYLEELENYNLHKRRTRAGENATYLEHQANLHRAELRTLEDNMMAFQQSNRNYASTSDPEVLATMGRFRRDIEVKTQAYLYLVQQLEISRFDQQKDTPVLRLLDAPSLPTQKSGPFRAFKILLAGLLSITGFLMYYLISDVARTRLTRREKELVRQCQDDITEQVPALRKLINRNRESVSI